MHVLYVKSPSHCLVRLFSITKKVYFKNNYSGPEGARVKVPPLFFVIIIIIIIVIIIIIIIIITIIITIIIIIITRGRKAPESRFRLCFSWAVTKPKLGLSLGTKVKICCTIVSRWRSSGVGRY